MTKDDFVAMCKEMLELGAASVSAEGYHVTFRPPQQQHGPRREPPQPDGKPPTAQSPEDARHGYYNRLMGGR